MYNAMNKYTDLNIYKPIDENINTIINYFTYFTFLNVQEFRSIHVSLTVRDIIPIKDGRFVACGLKNTIQIFDINKDKGDFILH